MREYPFRGLRRKRIYDHLEPAVTRTEFPCRIGWELKVRGKLRTKWINFGFDIGANYNIEDAVVVKDYKQLDALLYYLGGFRGLQGIFVESIN